MNAVVTAGGPIDGEFAALAGTDRKALAPVRGRTMIARTLDALRACGIERIAVVGNDAVARACATDAPVTMLGDAGTGSGNVLRALDAWPGDEPLLYLTCDMPYLDARSLQWFLDRVDARTLAMPLAEHGAYVERFPGAPQAGITLAGERVVNAGVFFVPAGSRERVRALATTMFEARKAPWRMARIAGISVLGRFLFGRVSVADLEMRARRVLDLNVAAPRNAPPELAFDVDTIDDYRYAIEHT
jgi:GTP:adenosylcobinamide-phosphate guanylyltransferase